LLKRGVNQESNLSYSIDDAEGENSILYKYQLDFTTLDSQQFSTHNVPTLLFFRLIGRVKSLPPAFWPYLAKTRIHTVILEDNQLDNDKVVKFAAALVKSKVHTVDLGMNDIDDKGIADFSHILRSNKEEISVHRIILNSNQITDKGAVNFIYNL
jgi:hypothetical protein